MPVEIVMLDKLKYVHLSHCYMRLGLCKSEMLVKGWKGLNFQLLIKFWQSGSKTEVLCVLSTIEL